MRDTKDDRGRPYPLGATVCPEGTNFSILSASAYGMQLALFDHADDRVAARTVTLDPVRNRTSHYWHIFCQESGKDNCMGIAQMALVILPLASVSILRKS